MQLHITSDRLEALLLQYPVGGMVKKEHENQGKYDKGCCKYPLVVDILLQYKL